MCEDYRATQETGDGFRSCRLGLPQVTDRNLKTSAVTEVLFLPFI